MIEYLTDCFKIIIILAIVFIIIGNISEYKNYNNYYKAIDYNNDYDIYLDGEKKDNSTFKISSLDKDKYIFKIDNANKEISISTNGSKNDEDNYSVTAPIFFH